MSPRHEIIKHEFVAAWRAIHGGHEPRIRMSENWWYINEGSARRTRDVQHMTKVLKDRRERLYQKILHSQDEESA